MERVVNNCTTRNYNLDRLDPQFVRFALTNVGNNLRINSSLKKREGNWGESAFAKTSGNVTGDAPAILTVPEFFAEVNLAQMPVSQKARTLFGPEGNFFFAFQISLQFLSRFLSSKLS